MVGLDDTRIDADVAEMEAKEVARSHAIELRQPLFGATPEAFDAMNVVAAPGNHVADRGEFL